MRTLKVPVGAVSATVFAAFIFLSPATARTQTVASSFDELRQLLKNGQHIVLTDTSGRRTNGTVADVGSSSLTVLAPETRTFVESSVSEIKATDPKWNGALLGAGIGTGFAMWDYLIDPSEPGNGIVFTAAIGMGFALGAGIDALITRGLVFRAPQRAHAGTWKLSPIVQKQKQGVLVSLRVGP